MMSRLERCRCNQDYQTPKTFEKAYLRDDAAELLPEKCRLMARNADVRFCFKQVYKGKAPGTDTQVSVLEESSSGYVVAVVDYNGFEKEMPKAPKAPSKKK